MNALDIMSSGETWAAGTDTTNSSVTQTLVERNLVTRPLPSVRFAAASASVIEGAGKATITVQLSATSAQPVTMQYATSNGTAVAPSDYAATSGTLMIDAGLTSKTFDITIVNDSIDEADEALTITLSAPTNATLGTPASATLTIVDDDAASAPSWPIYLPLVRR